MMFDEKAARTMLVAGMIALLIYGVGHTAPQRHRRQGHGAQQHGQPGRRQARLPPSFGRAHDIPCTS